MAIELKRCLQQDDCISVLVTFKLHSSISKPTFSVSADDRTPVPYLQCESLERPWGVDGGDVIILLPYFTDGNLSLKARACMADNLIEEATFQIDFDTINGSKRLQNRYAPFRLFERLGLSKGHSAGFDATKDSEIEIHTMKQAIDGAKRGWIRLRFEDLTPDDDFYLVTGAAELPGVEEAEVEFEFFDNALHPIDAQMSVLGNDLLPSRFDPTRSVRELRLSLRYPSSIPVITVFARDRNGLGYQGLFTLSPGLIAEYERRGRFKTHDASKDERYPEWLAAHRAPASLLERQRKQRNPFLSLDIIVPAPSNDDLDLLDAQLTSIDRQSVHCRQTIVVCVEEHPQECVIQCVAKHQNAHCLSLETWRHALASNAPSYVLFAEVGCILEPDLTYECSVAFDNMSTTPLDTLPDAIYFDNDWYRHDGSFLSPFFKPDFDIDLLRSFNYIGGVLCVKSDLVSDTVLKSFSNENAAAFNEDNLFKRKEPTLRAAASSYRRVLASVERSKRVQHIPKILVHEPCKDGSIYEAISLRKHVTTPRRVDDSVLAVREHLDRMGIVAEVSPAMWNCVQEIYYPVQENPLVSIIIPNKDCESYLDACVQSILEKTSYSHYEIVIVENNSNKPETFELYEALSNRDSRIHVECWQGEFNFSKIVNYGVAHARGDYLLLLNNDTEVMDGSWLERMLGLCQRQDVGVVGARLLYGDGSIQHAGALVTDAQTTARHAFMGLPSSNDCYYLFGSITRRCSAVTAACFITPRALFDKIGGFDELLGVAFNDVDYCFKVLEEGLAVIYEPAAQLRHYESISRGNDFGTIDKRIRFLKEESLMHYRWASVYVKGDPFFNPNLETYLYRLRF